MRAWQWGLSVPISLVTIWTAEKQGLNITSSGSISGAEDHRLEEVRLADEVSDVSDGICQGWWCDDSCTSCILPFDVLQTPVSMRRVATLLGQAAFHVWNTISILSVVAQCIGILSRLFGPLGFTRRKEQKCMVDTEVQTISWLQDVEIKRLASECGAHQREVHKMKTRILQLSDERDQRQQEVKDISRRTQQTRDKMHEIHAKNEQYKKQINTQADRLTQCLKENHKIADQNRQLEEENKSAAEKLLTCTKEKERLQRDIQALREQHERLQGQKQSPGEEKLQMKADELYQRPKLNTGLQARVRQLQEEGNALKLQVDQKDSCLKQQSESPLKLKLQGQLNTEVDPKTSCSKQQDEEPLKLKVQGQHNTEAEEQYQSPKPKSSPKNTVQMRVQQLQEESNVLKLQVEDHIQRQKPSSSVQAHIRQRQEDGNVPKLQAGQDCSHVDQEMEEDEDEKEGPATPDSKNSPGQFQGTPENKGDDVSPQNRGSRCGLSPGSSFVSMMAKGFEGGRKSTGSIPSVPSTKFPISQFERLESAGSSRASTRLSSYDDLPNLPNSRVADAARIGQPRDPDQQMKEKMALRRQRLDSRDQQATTKTACPEYHIGSSCGSSCEGSAMNSQRSWSIHSQQDLGHQCHD